ncbi:ferrochelatase [Alkalimarinus alittae]|uniref:Ferrochelatase n=1 Tax=Alkalimarinus alittae TaxID=2961619 RepID=A0ABY6N3J4_9ALTE|nr:ferrochelatase [Alkalimarinus alittae]UZE96600.1 ferrochelatase [Alkalimarinus alittae]
MNPSVDSKKAVLLVNLGTPDEPTAPAIRRYLKEFLSDPRVIETPRVIWWFILNLIILRFRPSKLVEPYSGIWQDGESPIRRITNQQVAKLQQRLNRNIQTQHVKVAAAMTYGNPSFQTVLKELQVDGYDDILVLPLYPQYSATTTAASWDALSRAIKKMRNIPQVHFIKRYCQHPLYIEALATTVRNHWESTGRQAKLFFSFHGIPKSYIDKGDPYQSECITTANLVAEALQLSDDQWQLCYQSRVGAAEWLKPYTDETMKALGNTKLKGLDVICPGFSADCLETIEEIDEENRGYFEAAGGSDFHYIPALNDQDIHIDLLEALVKENL